MRKIRGGCGILEVDAIDAVFSQTGGFTSKPGLHILRLVYLHTLPVYFTSFETGETIKCQFYH